MKKQIDSAGPKVGLYVDVSNLTMNGGYGMQFEVLREFACRGHAVPIRLNAYVSFDSQRAKEDAGYHGRQHKFHSKLRDLGYKVIEKPVKWYTDENGDRLKKSNVDLDLAVDALLQSENIDRVLLATGDGDFVQVVRALQNRGCRVEVVGFDNVSGELRREADLFVSGFLVPNLLPVSRSGRDEPAWGESNSFVRGIYYSRDPEKRYGWMRYLWTFESELWKTDARQPDSPYRSIFCHDSELPSGVNPEDLPSRNIVFEFRIAEDAVQKRTRAVDLQLASFKAADNGK